MPNDEDLVPVPPLFSYEDLLQLHAAKVACEAITRDIFEGNGIVTIERKDDTASSFIFLGSPNYIVTFNGAQFRQFMSVVTLLYCDDYLFDAPPKTRYVAIQRASTQMVSVAGLNPIEKAICLQWGERGSSKPVHAMVSTSVFNALMGTFVVFGGKIASSEYRRFEQFVSKLERNGAANGSRST
jgi:hypothetical protein